MVAIIQTGGKQYCVAEGQNVTVERLAGEPGDSVELTNLLNQKSVKATIVAHIVGDKVVSRKFRNKTRMQRVKGHRQLHTVLSFATQTEKKADETPKAAAKPRKTATKKATE